MILLGSSAVVTMTEQNQNYSESRIAARKAQDVGPAPDSNHLTQVRMKDSGKQKNNKYYLKYPNCNVSFKLVSELAIEKCHLNPQAAILKERFP